VSRDDETHGLVFGCSSRGNLFIFIPFCNMNLLFSLHSIFHGEESLGWEELVEPVGLAISDGGPIAGVEATDEGQDSEEEEEGHEEGHEEGAGLDDEGLGVMGPLQDPHPHIDLGVATLFTLL
jgi:hypothetical protein